MKTLKTQILNLIELGERGYGKQLSEIAGYSNIGNLNRILTKPEKEFDRFQGLISLVEHLFKEESVKKMVQYAEEIDPNKKTARNMLEYLIVNREIEAFETLVDKMENCTNKESQSWAMVYKILRRYEIEDNMNQLIQDVSMIKVNVSEMNALKNILLNYCYSVKFDFSMTNHLANQIEMELSNVDNEYIKEMYEIRLNEVRMYNSLRSQNNPELARKYAENIINSNCGKGKKAYAYFIIGYSYMFTSHENAMKNLRNSMLLYNELNRTDDAKDVEQKIEFLNLYWNKFAEKECVYKINNVYLQVRNNEITEEQLMLEKENINDEAFFLYLQGLKLKNVKKLILSMLKYIKKSDVFLATISKLELIKNGYDEEILEEMISLNLA